MDQPLIRVAEWEFTLPDIVLGAGAAIVLLLVILLFSVWRASRRRIRTEALDTERQREMDEKVAELLKIQNELTGRLHAMGEVFGSQHSDLTRTFNERLDGIGQRLGQNLTEASRNTHENLQKLHERLAVIDRAQGTITDLSGQVVALQQILSNKQSRGAFGQGRMEAILADALPDHTYSLQPTLSNGTRPDCTIRLPNEAPVLVIDAKFPLEAYHRIRAAETPEAEKSAAAHFRKDIQKHITDIRERYFLPGETQDTAFMFVPSESVFAELHENYQDLIQRAHRARVVIVSPSLLMLSIQVIQSVLRDARVREQAHVIQFEVIKLMEDVNRLNDRVLNLQKHFGQSQRDIDQILISSEKIANRGGRIEALDVLEEPGKAIDHEDSSVAAFPLKSQE